MNQCKTFEKTTTARLRRLVGLALLAASSATAAADLSLIGFGSIVAGAVVKGDGYIADYPNMGIYGKHGNPKFGPKDDGWLNQETRFGLQGTAALNDSTRATIQLTSRGTRDYQPQVEWFYATHELSDQLDVQAGKMRLPVYLYSDKMDVGFAYPWLRVPSDAYSLDSVNFSGARVNYKFNRGDASARLSLYGGTDIEDNSKLMSYLFDTEIDRKHRFSGVVADLGYDFAQLRLSYTRDKMQQTTPDPANAFRNENFNEEFFDVALQLQFGNLTLLGEWNRDRPFYKSWYTSAVYQMNKNAFYATYSEFKLDLPWEKHNQTSVGIRRDIGTNMALKFDVTYLRDKGLNPFTGAPNPVIKIPPGNATVASVAFDFIF